ATLLAPEAFHGRRDRCGVDDEQVGRPRHDRLHGSLARVAGAMGKTLSAGRGLLRPGEAEVDTGSEVGVDRGVRVDGLVTQPAAPRVPLAHHIEVAHVRTVTLRRDMRLARPPHSRPSCAPTATTRCWPATRSPAG